MDLRLIDVEPAPMERAAVDALLGPPRSRWDGGSRDEAGDSHTSQGGRAVREQRHPLLPALEAVQSRAGWISEGALTYICQRLGVPPADAWGVATFTPSSQPHRDPAACCTCAMTLSVGRAARMPSPTPSSGPQGLRTTAHRATTPSRSPRTDPHGSGVPVLVSANRRRRRSSQSPGRRLSSASFGNLTPERAQRVLAGELAAADVPRAAPAQRGARHCDCCGALAPSTRRAWMSTARRAGTTH